MPLYTGKVTIKKTKIGKHKLGKSNLGKLKVITRKRTTNKGHHKTQKLGLLGGGLLWTWAETKFAYILANAAIKYAIGNSSDYDDETKHLLNKAFRKIFISYVNNFMSATDIRDNTNTKSLKLVFQSIKNYKKIDKYTYEIDKYKPSMQYSNYVTKLLDDYIKNYILYLKSNSTRQTSARQNSIQEPSSEKTTSGDPYMTITFYSSDTNIKVPNILYRIDKPIISSSNTKEEETKKKTRHALAHEMINSHYQYARALNYYIKYRVSNK